MLHSPFLKTMLGQFHAFYELKLKKTYKIINLPIHLSKYSDLGKVCESLFAV